jgi:hypothetical protein
MQRNYKSVPRESAFTSQKELSDEPFSTGTSLFNIMETKEIPGFPNYFVSNEGKVFSDASGKWIILKPDVNWAGYHRIALHKKGIIHRKAVHRLVAELFIPNPMGYKEVNHLNFDKGDNRAVNLEWTSRIINQRYSIAAGRRDHVIGEGHYKAKLTKMEVRKIRDLYIPRIYPAIKIAKQFNVSRRLISDIINYKIWKSI